MMEIIFESKTIEPTEFVLPNGETVVNFGHIQIIPIDEIEQGQQ